MKSLFSIYLRVLAGVLYVQFISSQFYDPTGDGAAETIYRILDPLLVLGMTNRRVLCLPAQKCCGCRI